MNEPDELSLSAVNRKRGEAGQPVEPGRPAQSPREPARAREEVAQVAMGAPSGAEGLLDAIPFDPLRVAAAVTRGAWMILASGVALGALAAIVGALRFENFYTASAQIIRRELPNSFRASDLGEAFKPRQFSAGTITAMMRSPSLLARVGAQAKPRVSGSALSAALQITPERNTDLITISLKGQNGARETADLLNLYAQQVVELTKGLQAQEAAELDKFLQTQLARTESELAQAGQELLDFSREASFFSSEREVEAYLRALNDAELRIQTARLERDALDFRIRAAERELARQDPQELTDARDRLATLRVLYTDLNPLVIEQEAVVSALEQQAEAATDQKVGFQASANAVVNSLYLDLVNYRAQREAMDAQFPQLEAYHTNLLAKLQKIPEKNLRYAKLKAREASLEVTRDLLAGRLRETQIFTDDSPGYYRLFAPVSPEQVAESSRTRKISVVSVAGLLLGAGGMLLLLAFAEILDDRIVTAHDLRRATGCPVWGQLGELDSSGNSERATAQFRAWSLVQRELSVADNGSLLVGLLSARAQEGRSEWVHVLQAAAAERDWPTISVLNRSQSPLPFPTLPLKEALEKPQAVAHALARDGHVSVLYTPEWEWSAVQRGQWRAALRHWRALPGVAVLVELPPAKALTSIMLAESLTHVLWIGQSGATRKGEVADLFRTLRLAQLRVRGAFLNRASSPLPALSFLGRFGLTLRLACACLFCPTLAQSAALPSVPGDNNMALSAAAAGPLLAPWQQRLTLGPGDLVNLSIYGKKQYTRTEVPVGPDGRISYLQANGVVAAGLTIDELRDTLTAELRKYYKNARVIVTPAAWRSKKYYLLGTIMDRGTYYLDQPMTIIEATARARGIATGLLEQNTVEIADLPRAFLIRQGKRMPVDFAKLFQQGDLTQNIQLEPGDYIYFPSATVNEVYILGSVDSPGTVGVTEKVSVISVITTRGGFLPKAYKQRVLVVRGSLSQPQTHVVNVGAILAGKSPDFLLEPKDIVYVADRPWARVEELLDIAIKAFVVTATAEWVNQNLGPVIAEPILPDL